MALAHYIGYSENASTGKPLKDTVIRVYSSTGNVLQAVFADINGTPKPVVTSDENGAFDFYIADGNYDIEYVYNGVVRDRISRIAIFNPDNYTDAIDLSGTGGAGLVGTTDGDTVQEHLSTIETTLDSFAFGAFGAVLVANDTQGDAIVDLGLDGVSKPYTFASVATSSIPTAVTRITITDRGGMIVKRAASDPGTTYPANMKTQDATGAWWIYDVETQESNAAHFGIIREPWGTFGGPNEAAKLQAWIKFIADVHHPLGANMQCEARFDGPLDFKTTAGGLWQTVNLRGIMRLRGGSYVTDRYSIEIDDTPNYFHWEGGIIHNAFGEATFINRRNAGGIVLGNTSRGYFAILMSSFNIANGVKIVKDTVAAGGVDNANLLKIGRCGGYTNGCGWETGIFSYGDTVGSIIQYGADSSTDQRSRISVGTAFFPSWFSAFDLYVGDLGVASEVGTTRTDCLFLYIQDVGLRKITYREGNSAVWVYPKVPSSAVGKAMYIVGGAQIAFEGSDSNIPEIGIVEGAINGIGIALGQAYGSTINQFHADGCGVAIAVGSYLTGTGIEHVIQNAYIEAAFYHDVANTSINARLNVLGGVGGHPTTGKLRVANCVDPVSSAGVSQRQYPALVKSKIRIGGKEYRDHGNVTRFTNAVTLEFGGDNPPFLRANASTLTITLTPTMETFADCVDALGARQIKFTSYGTAGTNYHVANVTFLGISGYKYNGGTVGAALNETGLTAPTPFEVTLDPEDSNNIMVTKL